MYIHTHFRLFQVVESREGCKHHVSSEVDCLSPHCAWHNLRWAGRRLLCMYVMYIQHFTSPRSISPYHLAKGHECRHCLGQNLPQIPTHSCQRSALATGPCSWEWHLGDPRGHGGRFGEKPGDFLLTLCPVYAPCRSKVMQATKPPSHQATRWFSCRGGEHHLQPRCCAGLYVG